MSHRDFQDLVDEHAEEFDAASEAMTEIVLGVLEEEITPEDGEAQIAKLVEELQKRSTGWVLSVLPAIVSHATSRTTEALGAGDSPAHSDAQAAALELASLELGEALHNVAEQMARDARRQIREGLRIRMEEEVAK